MADIFQVFSPRIIGEDVAVDEPDLNEPITPNSQYQNWVPPKMTGPVVEPSVAKNDGPSANDIAKELDALREEAKKQGFQQGLAEGQAEAKGILAEQSQQLQLAIAALRESQKYVDAELERELLKMTMVLASQLLRHEISVKPEIIENLVHQAIEALPVSNGDLSIWLNPADADVLRQVAEDRGEAIDSSWILQEDATISRGGCRISNEYSRIDEELETRLQRITADIVGAQEFPPIDG
ncbi:Uncharacterised protein [Zhongshania aliphaticivorans]|uniref:Flagellar assembly protein FliH n=1 Tax=Zhongshania aliphaticivorans TaxID=1470434 RepID=A0A5S9NJF9_9GAMM|nr:FliH/SctL family protein [Zhongshania aliphaticivorans]CAA0090739.1 Uncharacterised protein [Zhongshania aliphaticivorans]CAA0098236.1 Uncharacterised protein [Zhongshania aliphaticivorans]